MNNLFPHFDPFSVNTSQRTPITKSKPSLPPILYVEDEIFMQLTAKDFLMQHFNGRDFNPDIVTACSGQDAEKLLQQSKDAKRPFGWVITDYDMPKGDGAYVIQKIAELGLNPMITVCSNYSLDFLQREFKQVFGEEKVASIQFVQKLTYQNLEKELDNFIKKFTPPHTVKKIITER